MNRLNFDLNQVISTLDNNNPVLWRKASPKAKSSLDKASVLNRIRSHESSLKEDLVLAEKEIKKGHSDWEDYLTGFESCDLSKGFQGYVERVMIESWS